MASPAYSELVMIEAGAARLQGMLEIPPDPVGVVLFAHGSGSSRFSPRNNYVAGVLRDARLATLLPDLLTPLEDQDYQMRFDIAQLADRLLAARALLRQHPQSRALAVGLFGASTGAAAALRVAASGAAAIGAVVSRGGRPDLAGQDALERVTAPTLLIVGGLDGVVVSLNRSAYETMICEKELAIISGATHLFEEPGTLEAAAKLASNWFADHLTRPFTRPVSA
ncbi:MAG: putative phosphoribosyltransferase [Noviherbaspirillum sp.]|jgi:putative phosphoribosyl transferase|nr:putative phosphoribosyltransferase [Noviherbaspirillum sp.]